MSNSFELGKNSWGPPDQAAADQYMAYASDFDVTRSLEQFDRVSTAAREYVTGKATGAKFRDLIRSKIEKKEPGSFIRLGDADGNVLFHAMPAYPDLAKYCLRKISKIYFGNESLMVEHSDFFTSTVLDAIENADGIGGPERDTVRASFDKPYPDLDVRGMCGMRGVYNYLAADYDLKKISNAVWSSTWFSRALLPHYFDFLKDLPFVSFITCYENLAELVQKRTGIKEVETLLVPMQASIAYQTKRTANMTKDIGHYPGAYPSILGAINPPHAGALYIIAAGILSKPYCTRVKERGGIAIDIGSIADVWMNTRSRPSMSGQFVDQWSLIDAPQESPKP